MISRSIITIRAERPRNAIGFSSRQRIMSNPRDLRTTLIAPKEFEYDWHNSFHAVWWLKRSTFLYGIPIHVQHCSVVLADNCFFFWVSEKFLLYLALGLSARFSNYIWLPWHGLAEMCVPVNCLPSPSLSTTSNSGRCWTTHMCTCKGATLSEGTVASMTTRNEAGRRRRVAPLDANRSKPSHSWASIYGLLKALAYLDRCSTALLVVLSVANCY